MGRKFKIAKNCYGDYDLYKKPTITINPGVTVLVGCNGSGKTTLLHQLKNNLTENKIPVVSFDNLHDGGHNAVSEASFYNDFSFMSQALCSSEGENIILNIGKLASKLRKFIKTGKAQNGSDQLAKAFTRAVWDDKIDKETNISKERWLLLDAVDSGLSVDNIVEIKELLFKTILEDSGDCDIYIVVSANEYEIARNENCFDVYNGKYIKFKDYEEYRNFIMESRKQKNERYN